MYTKTLSLNSYIRSMSTALVSDCQTTFVLELPESERIQCSGNMRPHLLQFDWLILSSANMCEKMIVWCLENKFKE